MEQVQGRFGLPTRARQRIVLLLLVAMTVVSLPVAAAVIAPTGAPAGAVPTAVAPATISVGIGFSCGITEAGGAVCWGTGTQGQLGNGSTSSSSTPVAVAGLSSGVTAISSAATHTCAVASGAAWCWGNNSYGQMGNGTSGPAVSTPVPVTGLAAGVTAISASGNHSCAVVWGAALCWGQGTSGQLGDGTTNSRTTPVAVSRLDQGVTAISAGDTHTCAVQTERAMCWGANLYGQLGNGSTTPSLEAVQAGALDVGVTAIAAGGGHTCAVQTGTAMCWGLNNDGQLGDGSTSASSIPLGVNGLQAGVTAISAGGSSTCAVVSGAARCWGADNAGQLGDRSFTASSVPVTPAGLTAGVSAIDIAGGHACAVVSKIAHCWGAYSAGQLGWPTSSTVPLTAVPTSGVTAIDAGATSHTCAIESGAALCWGDGSEGQLGNGQASSRPGPVPVTGLGSGVTAIATGGTTSCAVVSGAARCWGYGADGQLGNGSTASSSVPVGVSGLTTGVTAITVGARHACALKSGGAWCWGVNSSGQLGNTTTTSSTEPGPVVGLSSGVTAIDAGDNHTCAVVSGSARCWGIANNGRLGNGSTSGGALTPVQVNGLTSGVTAISLGSTSSCAIAQGAAWCWGMGVAGRLGNGSTSNATTPVAVSGLDEGVTEIGVGAAHACAVVSGAARCWGNGINGRLGDGSTTSATTPVAATGLTSGVTAITGGDTHTCALVSAAVWCWGSGASGQLAQEQWAPREISGGLTFLDPNAPTNSPPAATPQSLNVPRGQSIPITLSGVDPDGDDLTFALVDMPTRGSMFCSPTGECSYSSWGFAPPGPDSFTFTAHDGTATSPPATVSINVTNQPPTADSKTVTAARSVPTELQLSGADPNGDPLTFIVTNHPSQGSLSCSPHGSCTYTAFPWAAGSDFFAYTAHDGDMMSSPAGVTVMIANTPPIAAPHAATVDAGAPTTIALPASDPDGGTPTCFTGAPARGTLSGGQDCTRTYTSNAGGANAGIGGNDDFIYLASDGYASSSPATVAITIVNPDLSLTSAHTGTFAPGTGTGTYTLTVANTDAAPAPGTTTLVDTLPAGLTFRSADVGTSGFDCSATEVGATTVTCTRGETVPEGASLVVSLTVDVSTGAGSSVTNQAVVSSLYELAATASDNTATDTAELNRRPTIADVATATEANTAVDIATPADDPDHDVLTYAVIDQPDHGTVGTGEGMTRTYTPAGGFRGVDTFTVAATDVHGLVSHTATITVHVGVRPVRGVVTDSVSGDPLAGVQVTLYRTTGAGTGPAVGTVTSATDGTYDLGALYPAHGAVPSGTYAIRWADPAHRHVTEWHADAPDRASGTDTVVAAGAAPLARDAALTPRARVSGTVTSTGGANLDGIQVRLVPAGGSGGTVATTVGGAFSFEGMAAGDYQVWFRSVGAGGYVSEWWDESPTQAGSDVITLTDGQHLDLDEELAPVAAAPVNGTVTGTVRSAADGAPIAGVQVRLYPEPYTASAATTTASDGTYRFDQRPAGRYKLFFRDVSGRQWVSEHNGDSADVASAPPVVVIGGRTTTVDAALSPVAPAPVRDASIGGTVTGPDGAPIVGLQVRLYVTGETASAATTTDADGRYSFTRRLPGEYQLFFRDLSGTWVSEWSGDASSQATASAVTATGGASTTIDATLEPR